MFLVNKYALFCIIMELDIIENRITSSNYQKDNSGPYKLKKIVIKTQKGLLLYNSNAIYEVEEKELFSAFSKIFSAYSFFNIAPINYNIIN